MQDIRHQHERQWLLRSGKLMTKAMRASSFLILRVSSSWLRDKEQGRVQPVLSSCRETVSPWGYRAGDPSTSTDRSLHSRAQNPQSYIEPLEYGVKKWSKGRKGTSAMPPSFQSGRNSDPTRQYRNPQFTRTLFSGPLGNMRKTWQGMVIFATLIVLMVLWVYTYVKIYWVI